MQSYTGRAISKGLAIGKAVFVAHIMPTIPTDKIACEDVQKELDLLQEQIAVTKRELEAYLKGSEITDSEKDILSTHIEILDDPEILAMIRVKIEEDLYPAAKSIELVFDEAIEIFRSMANNLFAERSSDFEDVKSRLIRQILDSENEHLRQLDEDSIPIFEHIQPSDISALKQRGISGFLAENLSYT